MTKKATFISISILLIFSLWFGQKNAQAATEANALYLPLVVKPVEPKPDLILTIEITSYEVDRRIDYTYTIKNIGNAPANLDGPTDALHDNVSIQNFLSADQIFKNEGDVAAGGSIIGYTTLGMLAPGETFTGTYYASGSYNPLVTPYLVAKVDYSESVEESDETNNTAAVLIQP